jgi:hypothetical protein
MKKLLCAAVLLGLAACHSSPPPPPPPAPAVSNAVIDNGPPNTVTGSEKAQRRSGSVDAPAVAAPPKNPTGSSKFQN